MNDDLLQEMEAGHGPTPSDRARRRRLATTVAICGLAFIGFGQLSTGAFFTDQADASLTYTAGDVAIQANGVTHYSLPAATFANMAPGDVRYVPLTISSAGSLDLRYAMTGVSTDGPNPPSSSPLSGILQYNVYAVATTSCNAAGVASATALNTANQTVGTTETAVFGNKATGGQPGDRALSAMTSEPLCVGITFPSSADNSYQKDTVAVTFTFYAEQTANNA
jgi:hypothetical protein